MEQAGQVEWSRVERKGGFLSMDNGPELRKGETKEKFKHKEKDIIVIL